MLPRLLSGIIVVSFCGALLGDEPSKAVKEELKRLEGEWKIVAAEQGGKAVKSNDLVVFSGGKCTVTNPAIKIVLEYTVSIDPSKTPKRIEVTNTKTKEVWVGIYELEGDKLRCLFYGKDAKAPTEFKTQEGGLEVMYTYERVKPE
jgi:uncharacterized protein (TIGR03067 family)